MLVFREYLGRKSIENTRHEILQDLDEYGLTKDHFGLFFHLSDGEAAMNLQAEREI